MQVTGSMHFCDQQWNSGRTGLPNSKLSALVVIMS